MRPTNVCAMFLWCIFGANAVPGCGHCVEQEENGLVQLVNLQPNVESSQSSQSSQSHPGGARSFRRFRRFGRYGAKTSSTSRAVAESTTQALEATGTSTTMTVEATTVATTTSTTSTTSTTTTRVVCGAISGNVIVPSTPQNVMTLNVTLSPFSAGTSQECQCVGGIFSGSAPGYLGVELDLTADFTAAYMISITSPNGTEAIVPPVRSGSQLFANTVAFAGFQGLGSWTIKLLDASGNPSIQKAARAKVEFRLQACNQILALPDCFGNWNRGNDYLATNLSLVGTNLSSSPTLLQFDVEVSSACCVPAFSGPGSGGSTSRLQLEFTPGPNGFVITDGFSPDGIPVNWTRAAFQNRNVLGTTVTLLGPSGTPVAPGFAGAPAAGRWSIYAFTDGDVAVINNVFQNPYLRLRLEPCG